MSNGHLWQLVDWIIKEKWDSINGIFKGGDISETLLKEIARVLSERSELNIRPEWAPSGIVEIRDKDGNLFGHKRFVDET